MKLKTKTTIFICFLISGIALLLLASEVFAGTKEQTKFACSQGYSINIDKTFYTTGIYLPASILTGQANMVSFICDKLDQRVNSWVSSRLTHPTAISKCKKWNGDIAGCLRSVAHGKAYTIINHFIFKCSESVSGYCAGLDNRKIPLYSDFKGEELPTYNYPPHTVMLGVDVKKATGYKGWLNHIYYVGNLNYLPVVGHELDHNIGIGN